MYDDKSSYSAKLFLDELIQVAPFPIRMVQTDNGPEFTNALLVVKPKHRTLFEDAITSRWSASTKQITYGFTAT